jgi:chromosome transmission fidelity protein 4
MIGEHGTLFACQAQNKRPAQVLYKPNTSSQSEWIYPLKHGSKVIGLASGGSDDASGNMIIATSENDLTFMSGNMIESYVMGLDGEFVSMVAGKEWVFVVNWPGATTFDGESFFTNYKQTDTTVWQALRI